MAKDKYSHVACETCVTTDFCMVFGEVTSEAKITTEEIESFIIAPLVITYELSLRFLMDYLMGDVYFKIHREGHNLDRARTQFKLVSDMEKNIDNMRNVINKILNK